MSINFSRPSDQMLKAIAFLRSADNWVTSEQVALAAGCKDGTARAYLRRLMQDGVVAVQPRFPAYLYKLEPEWDITPVGQFLNSLA